MILQAIHSKISGVCHCYPLLGDIESTTPFAVYTADQTILRDKTGIAGYEYIVGIMVVDEDLSETISVGTSIKSQINGLENTTVMNTTFDKVHLYSENQRFDEKALCYINDIEYKILTKNV
jgi:predicted class III extradiol MEMO1 family dioxygenase